MDPKNLARKRLMTADDLFNAAETPLRPTHHRRAHSDTAFLVDDLLLLDPSDLDFSSLDLPATPAPPRVAPASVDSPSVSDDSESNGGYRNPRPNPVNHLRSLSVDSDFFDGLTLTDGGGADIKTASFEAGEFDVGVKKAMRPDKLAELSLIDPKRAKRILANRQSAARSKERKVRYTNELERKVQTLQTEATTLSTQVTMLQRDTTGLTTENKELKLRLQAMEQQAKLKNALNDALREEVQRLKIATGQIPAVNGNPFNVIPRFPSHQPTVHHFGGQPNQQQQPQLHMPQSSTNGQHHSSLSNFG